MKGQHKDYMPLHVMIREITMEQKEEAALTCAMYAEDGEELRMFLIQLGLIDVR